MSELDDARHGQRHPRGSSGGRVAARRGARRRADRWVGEEMEVVPTWVLPAIVLGLTTLAAGVVVTLMVGLACGFWWLVRSSDGLVDGPGHPTTGHRGSWP